jgi:hypothetical protein
VRSYGGTAGAGAPSVLSMRWDSGQTATTWRSAVSAAGLTWASYPLRFEGPAQ